MTSSGSPSTAYSNLSGSNSLTVEAIVFINANSPVEQYIFDPRSTFTSGKGLMFGINYNGTNWRPSTWATGTAAEVGTGGSLRTATSGNMVRYTWNHIAWVKQANDASNIFMYVNGAVAGTVVCGPNASTNSEWGKLTIGCPGDALTGTYNFRGRIARLRVSNTALYTAAFVAPLSLTQLSSTAQLHS